MIGPLLAALATGAFPHAERFWDRDLGGLARTIAEARLAGERGGHPELFEELLRLLRCEPLGALGPDDPDLPLRSLLRLEEARRARLGDGAARAATLWRDALAPGFFRMGTGDAAPRPNDLVWPAERETWPGEVLAVGPLSSRCLDTPPRRGGSELPAAEWIGALRASGEREAAGRLAYHRAVLLARAGDDAWRRAAREIDPGALAPELAPFATLLRLEAGADTPDGYLALLDALPEESDPWVSVAACAADLHARAGRAREALAVAERGASLACGGGRAPAVRALRFHRAAALAMTGRGGEVAAALSAAAQCAVPAPDPQAQAFRELVIALAGGRPYGEVEPLLQALGGSGSSGDVLWGWGRAALAAGNVEGAAEAARALAAGAGRARGHALAAEVAFARGDARAFEASVDALLALRVAAGERADRDRLAIEVASSAAVLQAGDPRAGRGAALARALDRIESALPLSRTPATARIREALRNASSAQRGRGKGPLPVALGVVAVSARPLPPPLPTLPIAWPEPRSLLAIPTAGGGTRDWFDAPVAAAGNPP